MEWEERSQGDLKGELSRGAGERWQHSGTQFVSESAGGFGDLILLEPGFPAGSAANLALSSIVVGFVFLFLF